MRVFRWTLLLLLLWTTTGRAQTVAPLVVTGSPVNLSAEEIVRRAVANDELRRRHRFAFQCDLTIHTERLDAEGKVFKSKTVRVVHRDSPHPTYFVDVDAGAAGRDRDTVKAQQHMAAMDLRRLAPHFRFALAGEDTVRGRACYVIAYSPKENQAAASREETITNHLHGRYWIDRSTFEILQGEGALAGPLTLGLVATVTRTDFALHTQTLPNGEVGPAEFSLDVAVKAPFYFFHQRQTNRLENWRPK